MSSTDAHPCTPASEGESTASRGTRSPLALTAAAGVATAVRRACSGAVRAGWEAAEVVEGEDVTHVLSRGLVAGSSIIGTAVGVAVGPGGLLVGALAGPGAVGTLMASVHEAAQGASAGVRVGCDLGSRVRRAAVRHVGSFLGQVAGLSVGVAASVVAAPLLAVEGVIVGGYRGLARALGFQARRSEEDAWAESARGLLLGVSVGVGVAAAVVHPLAGIVGMVSAAGGAGSVFSGVIDGAAGFCDRLNESLEADPSTAVETDGGSSSTDPEAPEVPVPAREGDDGEVIPSAA